MREQYSFNPSVIVLCHSEKNQYRVNSFSWIFKVFYRRIVLYRVSFGYKNRLNLTWNIISSFQGQKINGGISMPRKIQHQLLTLVFDKDILFLQQE